MQFRSLVLDFQSAETLAELIPLNLIKIAVRDEALYGQLYGLRRIYETGIDNRAGFWRAV